MQVFSSVDHAWAAGFFDGEGCVRIKPQHRGRSYVPVLLAVQVSKEPIDRLRELYGGSVRERVHKAERQRNTWEWERNGVAGVRHALESMTPYLIVKRRQAEVALRLCDEMRVQRGWPPLTDDELSRRQVLSDEMRTLNLRGAR